MYHTCGADGVKLYVRHTKYEFFKEYWYECKRNSEVKIKVDIYQLLLFIIKSIS